MAKDMTTGNPAKHIIGFAIPVFVGSIFQQFYNIVDTMIVGRFVGVNALAAVGSTSSIIFCVQGICFCDPAAWVAALIPLIPLYYYRIRQAEMRGKGKNV